MTIKPFSGEKSADGKQLLRIFVRHSKIKRWSDSESVEVAVLHLNGPAEVWDSEQVERGKIRLDATWAQWKEAFIQWFVNVETTDEVIDQLLNLKLKKHELVEDFRTRVQDLVRKGGKELPVDVISGVFKKGLQSSFRLELEIKGFYRSKVRSKR